MQYGCVFHAAKLGEAADQPVMHAYASGELVRENSTIRRFARRLKLRSVTNYGLSFRLTDLRTGSAK
jgi:hypothetical protein